LASQINASNSGFGGIVSTGDSSGVLQLQAAGTTVATIQSTGLNLGSNGLVFSDASTQTAAASPYVLKNRIINGDMVIDQRNAGASVSASNATYTLDRWVCGGAVSNKFTVQQNAGSVTSPVGFNNYLGCTSSSAYSVPSGENYGMQQSIEGFNFADLGWGTANAKTVTLSFWVRSSLTGTFGGGFTNSAYDYSYVFSYSIPTANTWTQISVTIAGPTSGTWIGATNGTGARLFFSLGTGSSRVTTAGSWVAGYYASVTGETQIVATNGATLYITGVQLEQNTSATPFERRLYGQELINCQRYYEKSYPATVAPGTGGYVGPATVSARATSNGYCFYTVPFSVEKRGTPIINIWSYNGTASQLSSFDSGANLGAASALQITPYSFLLCNNSGGTIADGSPITINYSSSAEL
jgi:hypothetical protein